MAKVGRAAFGELPMGRNVRSEPMFRHANAAFRGVTRRLRLQAALDAGALLLLAGLAAAAIAITLQKLHMADSASPWLLLAPALPLLGVVLGALRSVPPLKVAQLLDRELGSPDLLGSAWSFVQLPEATWTPFMRACVQQAERAADRADPVRAFPLRMPRSLTFAVPLALAVCALALFDRAMPVQDAPTPSHKPHLLHEDDIAAFTHELAPLLLAQANDSTANDAAKELNTLVEALKDGTVDRLEALQALRELSKRLDAGTLVEDDAALREALRELGRTITQDTLAESVAEALRAGDASKAETELQQLAERLRTQPPRAADLRKLAQALLHAQSKQASDRLAQGRNEQQRLLKQKQAQEEPNEALDRLLKKKERELDTFERETAPRERAERQLDNLQRELSSAAHGLGERNAQQSAEHLEKAAQELAKAAQSQLSSERRKQLKERVQQLREMISKQRSQSQSREDAQAKAGQDGKPQPGADAQRLSLSRFVEAARGASGKPDSAGERPGAEASGMRMMKGQGAKPGESVLMSAPEGKGGEPVAVVNQPGNVNDPLAGQGGRPESANEASKLASKHIDTKVEGEQREGPSRSEVILESGQRGFASRPYERVHTDYERHAEAVLERDKIPGGYRFYVRRYFQLIRPREVQDE